MHSLFLIILEEKNVGHGHTFNVIVNIMEWHTLNINSLSERIRLWFDEIGNLLFILSDVRICHQSGLETTVFKLGLGMLMNIFQPISTIFGLHVN